MTPQPTLFITYIDSAEGMVIYDPWEQGQGEQSSALPLWQGEELSGQSLLVGKADRLADEILLANSYQDLPTKAPNPTIHCSPSSNAPSPQSPSNPSPPFPLPPSLFPLPPSPSLPSPPPLLQPNPPVPGSQGLSAAGCATAGVLAGAGGRAWGWGEDRGLLDGG